MVQLLVYCVFSSYSLDKPLPGDWDNESHLKQQHKDYDGYQQGDSNIVNSKRRYCFYYHGKEGGDESHFKHCYERKRHR